MLCIGPVIEGPTGNDTDKRARGWIRTGAIGSVVVALCCFTPVLVVFLAALGLGALAGYLDYVLFPLLGVFLVVLLVGVWRARGPR